MREVIILVNGVLVFFNFLVVIEDVFGDIVF